MSRHADFLVEIGTEELPPKDLQALVSSLAESLQQQLTAAEISFATTTTYATPRRLAVLISALAEQQPEQNISRRGPALSVAYNKDGTPTQAALGFANSCGVKFEQISTTKTDKGEWLYFEQTMPGQKTKDLLPTMLEAALKKLPVKKYMRWGQGEIEFVRPVHWIVLLWDSETIKTKIFGIPTGNISYGHRIHAPKPITISSPTSYAAQLAKAHVIAGFAERQQAILDAVNKLASKAGGTAIVDPDLLTMVTGLVEHPVALLASFDAKFLRVPKECLISAMQDHQKCFAIIDNAGKLLPKFILISNIDSSDPQTVIRGNELVMHARLADAAFYYDVDQKQTLESRVAKLKNIIYQKRLGSLYDKSMRIEKLATYLAPKVKADAVIAKRAAYLCKADLLTNMVYEFPELQGIMGYYYASHDQEPKEVAVAILEHYQPRFATDTLPLSDAGIALALADRIDSLVGLFGIDIIPTGEKDPFGLRRQALAILRILIENRIDLDLRELFKYAVDTYPDNIKDETDKLMIFTYDRLNHWYTSNGIPSGVFKSVLALSGNNPYDFHKRVNAMIEFLKLPEANDLAAAIKRVGNIIGESINKVMENSSAVQQQLLTAKEEQTLFTELQNKETVIAPLLQSSDYVSVLQSLATLKKPIDDFFDNVMVNVDDTKLRNNRLNLLRRLYKSFLQVADVSLL